MPEESGDDYTLIRVGDDPVGLRGLRGAFEEIAQAPGEKTDDEVQRVLLEKLRKKNYIADSARDEYGRALIREYRKFLGRPCEDATGERMTVVVLGPGCSQCHRLDQLVKQVLTELGLGVSVERVTDIKEIAQYGIIATPTLVINGKIVSGATNRRL